MEWLTDTTRCRHCYREFADHNYVTDSIDKYECPIPPCEAIYGFFHGGDPRNFTPDFECCTDANIAAWRAACDQWDNGAQPKIETGCRIEEHDGQRVKLTLASFGIGMNLHYSYTTFDPLPDEAAEQTEWLGFPEACIDCSWTGEGDDTGQCPICGGVCEPTD